jgi:hypothetical protein
MALLDSALMNAYTPSATFTVSWPGSLRAWPAAWERNSDNVTARRTNFADMNPLFASLDWKLPEL